MVQFPTDDGSPSVQRRIDMYCEEVKNRGGTPPTPTVGSRLRQRRYTMPHLDSSDCLHILPSRGRSSSSSGVAPSSDLPGAVLPVVVEERNKKGKASGYGSYRRKESTLSVRGIEICFGNGTESDSDEGGDNDEAKNSITPVTMKTPEQMELQRLREENSHLQKQLIALQTGQALMPNLSEDDPAVSMHCSTIRECRVP